MQHALFPVQFCLHNVVYKLVDWLIKVPEPIIGLAKSLNLNNIAKDILSNIILIRVATKKRGNFDRNIASLSVR